MTPRRASHLRLLLWPLVAIYWVALLVATHLPPSRLPNPHISDKIEHLLAYGLLAGALYLPMSLSRRSPIWIAIVTLGIVLIYGALDERTQPPFGRSCDLHDWYADAIGATLMLVILTVLRLVLPRPRSLAPTLQPAPSNAANPD